MLTLNELSVLLVQSDADFEIIGHNRPCFLDLALLDLDYIYGETGDMNHTLKIKPENVIGLNKDTRKITL